MRPRTATWAGVAAGLSMAAGIVLGAVLFPRYGWPGVATIAAALLLGTASSAITRREP